RRWTPWTTGRWPCSASPWCATSPARSARPSTRSCGRCAATPSPSSWTTKPRSASRGPRDGWPGMGAMKTHRLARVAEAIREAASETILFELRDPRVKLVTVTRAEVSGDLQHAKVYVSVMGTPAEQKRTLRGLQHAAGFVQSKLAGRLQTRFTPVL